MTPLRYDDLVKAIKKIEKKGRPLALPGEVRYIIPLVAGADGRYDITHPGNQQTIYYYSHRSGLYFLDGRAYRLQATRIIRHLLVLYLLPPQAPAKTTAAQ